MIARLAAVLALACLPHAASAQFDHTHAAWAALLKKHVVLINAGRASQVRYAGFQQDRAQLKQYLETLAAVSASQYQSWSKSQQLAFLINAYNAATIEKVPMSPVCPAASKPWAITASTPASICRLAWRVRPTSPQTLLPRAWAA